MGNPEARCMTWAVPQRYPPGYPAVTQGSSADPPQPWMIALEKIPMQPNKTQHPPRAQPCPFLPLDRPPGRGGSLWPPMSPPKPAGSENPGGRSKGPPSPHILRVGDPWLLVARSFRAGSPAPPSPNRSKNLCIHPGFFSHPPFHQELPRIPDTLPRFVPLPTTMPRISNHPPSHPSSPRRGFAL